MVRHRIRENIKGEHAGQRTDYFRARSGLYLRVSNSCLGPGFA